MPITDIAPAAPLAFNAAIIDLLRQAGVERSSVIRITGPGGLAPLLWLCRHGYSQVGYLAQGPCSLEACDLLLVLHCEDGQSVGPGLRNASRLREGGLLILQTTRGAAAGVAERLRHPLAAAGCEVERCLQGAHKDLLVARRRAVHAMRKAS